MIILQETLRAVFYAPFYAALALGAYDAEGVAVRLVRAPAPGRAADGLFDGTVDVAWGGPMRVMETYGARPDCDLVCFGEVVTRDPFFLVGRGKRPDFSVADLRSLRLASVSEVPTPWLCLQEDLRRVGIDPSEVTRISDRSMAQNAASLARGEVDVVQLFAPWSEMLLASGEGHLWHAAASRGATSYTTLYARRAVLAQRRAELEAMVRALYRTQKWLHGERPEALAECVQPYFPDISPALLRAAIARYHALGIWGRDPILPREGYERLKAGLVSSGFVAGTPFDVAVDNSLAEEIVREDPAALPPTSLQ